MTSRTEHLAALADTTADDIATAMDEAATEDDYYEALHSSLLAVGYPGIFTRVSAARVRVGLTTSEAARKATAREAEQRLMNQRAARRAG